MSDISPRFTLRALLFLTLAVSTSLAQAENTSAPEDTPLKTENVVKDDVVRDVEEILAERPVTEKKTESGPDVTSPPAVADKSTLPSALPAAKEPDTSGEVTSSSQDSVVTPAGDAARDKPVPASGGGTVPRMLSGTEEDSYVVGMMMADYIRSVLRTLEKLDVYPDEGVLREGLQDSLAGDLLMDGDASRVAIARFQKEMDRRQTERVAGSKKLLETLVGNKKDVLEKKDDRVWLRLKKGTPASGKPASFLLSWEGRFYDGDVFESVSDLDVTRREVLPLWLQRAVRLAGSGGQVRLYILAGSLEGEAALPAGTARHELVQYTVSVKKKG